MSKINIEKLNPAGSELFQDRESFLNELTDQEMGYILGGAEFASVISQASASVGTIDSATIVGISQSQLTVSNVNINATGVVASIFV